MIEVQDGIHNQKQPLASNGRRAALYTELSALREQQRETLEHATYFGMSPSTAADYERRARRTAELQRALELSAGFSAVPDYW
jgi:transcriptional regulator with XRE-family HTH domain